jgi:hypothetical protein
LGECVGDIGQNRRRLRQRQQKCQSRPEISH